jgi:hypothetical protein
MAARARRPRAGPSCARRTTPRRSLVRVRCRSRSSVAPASVVAGRSVVWPQAGGSIAAARIGPVEAGTPASIADRLERRWNRSRWRRNQDRARVQCRSEKLPCRFTTGPVFEPTDFVKWNDLRRRQTQRRPREPTADFACAGPSAGRLSTSDPSRVLARRRCDSSPASARSAAGA